MKKSFCSIEYTYDDFERAVAAGDAKLASVIEAFLLDDPYPADDSPPHMDDDSSVQEMEHDEMAELRKAALSRGQP